MRVALTTVLEVLAMVLLTVAGFAFDWRAGLAVVGLLLLRFTNELDEAVEP